MTKIHNVFDVPLSNDDGTPIREFRVSKISRYQVTDWTDYRGGSTKVLADDLTLDQANIIATNFGRAHPGSLVNLMEPPYEGGYEALPRQAISDDQIKHMVDRFLSWRLPDNFAPDGGISFKAAFNEHTSHPMRHEPMGTNLFDATQADAMVRHMIEGPPSLTAD